MTRANRVSSRAWAVVAITVACVSTASAQQPRDDRPVAASGDGAITGTILTTDRVPKPLRRVRVTLIGAEDTVRRTAITSDNGAFAFEGLPIGGYAVTASKDGYVAFAFGGTRPNGTGSRITLKNGDRKAITLGLPRGAVITGMLADSHGQPVSGVNVVTLSNRYASPPGERRLVRPGGVATSAVTDDRGIYRIYGLVAGEYGLMAQVRPGPGIDAFGELQEISPAEVRRALAEVRASAAANRPGMPVTPPTPAVAEPRRSVALAPVYFPGTSIMSRAQLVRVAAGEERHGVDFDIDYVPTVTVTGSVQPMDPSQPVSVILTTQLSGGFGLPSRTVRADPDGSFAVHGVVPGNYSVTAKAGRASASTQIVVSGEDLEGVSLSLEQNITVTGRVAFEGNRAAPEAPMLRLNLPPALAGETIVTAPSLQFGADRTFVVSELIPGRLRFFNSIQGVRNSIGPWWLKSLTVRGQEILDAPVELHGNVDDAVITFTDQVNELKGRVNGSLAELPTDTFVVVFPADRRRWFHNSRSIAAVKPAPDGSYSVKNLPPGEYRAALAFEPEPMEWFDPTFLEGLAPGAGRIMVAAEGVTVLDLTRIK